MPFATALHAPYAAPTFPMADNMFINKTKRWINHTRNNSLYPHKP